MPTNNSLTTDRLTNDPLTDRVTATNPTGSRLVRLFNDRFRDQPSWAAVTEVFIGLGWLRAASAKLIDGDWWTGQYLADFLADHRDASLGWYAPFLESVVDPNTAIVALTVLVLQVVVAVSLLSGRVRAMGLGLGAAMNLHFVAAGAVNPSAFYLLAQGALLLWMVDRWPSVRQRVLLPVVAAVGTAVTGFNLWFIRTVHPAEVIDDPAIMFATVGGLAALASVISLSKLSSDREPQEV